QAGEVPIPDVHDHIRARRRRLLHEVSRPVHLDAPAGRGHERASSSPAATRSQRTGRTRAWRTRRPPAEARRPGHDRLGEDLQGNEDSRGEELLRRTVDGVDEGKRGVPQDAEGLTAWRPPMTVL